MKKLFLFLICIFCFPFLVSAADYDIPGYYVDATVLENGDMHVKEVIVLDGEFNGYERHIAYQNPRLSDFTEGSINFAQSGIYNAKGIILKRVSAKKVSSVSFSLLEEEYHDFTLSSNPINGSHGLYSQKEVNDGYVLRTYEATDDSKTAFYYEYVISSAVVMHEDVAELYWQFLGEEFEDDIKDIKVNVHLPNSATEENYRIWAHGPLYGTVEMLPNYTGAVLEVKELDANTPVDLRMTFDKDLITDDSKLNHSKEEALSKILEVEEERSNDADAKRKQIKIIYYALKISIYTYLAGLIFLIIYIYIEYDKEFKTDFALDYYRDFIDDYNVEVVDYLNHKSITSNAMSASILNLVYKKNISVKEMEEKKKEYVFTLENENNITDSEKYLIDFLFGRVGDGKTFTTKELKKYAKSSSSYSKFQNSYETWKRKVESDGKKQSFFCDLTGIKIKAGLYCLLGFILFAFNLWFATDIVMGYVLPFIVFAFLIYILAFQRRTKKGAEHYAKWQAFKRFLLDFGTFDVKELPEIVLWERYLVYAVVLGVADKVQKAMNVKISEMDPSGTLYGNDLFTFWYYHNLTTTINQSVHTAIQNSYTAASANSVSSSRGFGGGFSSGGGFGGGGGGGHGF